MATKLLLTEGERKTRERNKIRAGSVLLLTLLSLVSVRSIIAEESKNLIKNSGFEGKTTRPWLLQEAAIDRTISHHGKQSVKITGTGAGMQRLFYNPPGIFKLESSCKYQLSFWMKLEKERGSFKVRIRQYKGKEYVEKGYYAFPLPETAGWKEYPYEFITVPESDNIKLDFYFINTKGIAHLDDISLEKIESVRTITSEELTRQLKKKLTQEGYKLRQEQNRLIAEKDDLRTYYRLVKDKKYIKPEQWRKEAIIGSEVDKLVYRMESFPIGVSLYGNASYSRAEELGMEKWDYMSKVLDDIKAHNMNTIWFGNTGGKTEKEDIDKIINLCEERGLKLKLQMSGAYYRCTEKAYKDDPEKRRRHFAAVNLPFVSEVMPRYKNRKGVFAWSVKEETKAEYAKELALYRKIVMKLDPTHPIIICHNNLKAAQSMEKPYPSIMGFDRYYYKHTFSARGYLKSPVLAISLFEDQVPPFYQASLKYRIPFFFVLQGVSTAIVDTDLSEFNFKKENEKRGWTFDRKSNTWSGWMRYYPPKHCMKLQVWAAVALGAKGIVCYNYGEPAWGKIKVWPPPVRPGFDKNEYTLSCSPSGKAAPQWKEFGEAAKNISYFAPLILRINKRVVNIASSENSNILISTFQEEDSNRKYLIVVNKRTGTGSWDSHKQLTPEDELSVNNQGQLVGYTPAAPLEFVFRVQSNDSLYDLRTLKKVDAISPVAGERSYKMILPPGEGSIFLLGIKKDFLECRKRFFTVQ